MHWTDTQMSMDNVKTHTITNIDCPPHFILGINKDLDVCENVSASSAHIKP
jgi:hypothetical protein